MTNTGFFLYLRITLVEAAITDAYCGCCNVATVCDHLLVDAPLPGNAKHPFCPLLQNEDLGLNGTAFL